MKTLFKLICLSMLSNAFASQVETECAGINTEREKIIKSVSTKGSARQGSSKQ